MTENVRVIAADYGNDQHAAIIVSLLDQYARDSAGGATPLSEDVKERLVPALAACGSAHSFIAFSGSEAAGLLNGFETLSTFRALPLFNIHDVIVAAKWRRRGIAQQLFAAAESFARERGCCKLTLEVLAGNSGARDLYRRLGFNDYSLLPAMGSALFLQKIF